MEILQGTPEWFDLKRGKISSTHMADILMKPSTAGYRNYLTKLTLERITGTTEETFCSFDMQRGIDLEPDAKLCYSFNTGYMVEEVPWIAHPTIPNSGCSPDGLINEDGGVEIKAPKAATHLKYLTTDDIDRDYILQIQWAMACQPKVEWIDFCSFHPSFPEHLQLKIIRVERDNTQISSLENAAVTFNRAVDQTVEDLNNL